MIDATNLIEHKNTSYSVCYPPATWSELSPGFFVLDSPLPPLSPAEKRKSRRKFWHKYCAKLIEDGLLNKC